MKPLLIYVDDEPRNLAVFEASVPDEWDVRVFESAVDALKAIKSLDPWVIVSDQKMPTMTGLEFLEVASQLVPDAVRIVVTGQTEEQTIIQLVRRAKISDYITKPWETEDLVACLGKAASYYKLIKERNEAFEEIRRKNLELEDKNRQQAQLVQERERALQQAVEYQKEVNEWAPAPIVWALKDGSLQLPARKDVVGIVFDIIKSSRIQGKLIHDRSIRSHIQNIFGSILLRHGGLCEAQPGDCAYGHFGAVPCDSDPVVAAYAAATEFRVALRSFAKTNNLDVECGIALHYGDDVLMQLNKVTADTPPRDRRPEVGGHRVGLRRRPAPHGETRPLASRHEHRAQRGVREPPARAEPEACRGRQRDTKRPG